MQNHPTKWKKIDDYFPTCQYQQPQDLDEQQLEADLGNFEEEYCFFLIKKINKLRQLSLRMWIMFSMKNSIRYEKQIYELL